MLAKAGKLSCRQQSRLQSLQFRISGYKFSTGSKTGEPVTPSIHLSSTFGFETVEDCVNVAFGETKGNFYTRWGNPTVELLEEKINELEYGNGALMFASGMNAISSTMSTFLKPGDHIIVPSNLYSGTYELFDRWLPYKNDIEISWVNHDISEYEDNIKQNTKLLYTESPSNPSNEIIDLTEFSKLATKYSEINKNEIMTAVDSTFGNPFNQLPIRDHNIDLCIHSATKILNGHSDVTAGCVIARDKKHYEQLLDFRRIYGSILSPFDCFLIYRGLKTLPIRSDRINNSAFKIAQWIDGEYDDIISQVNYGGLQSFKYHEVANNNLRKAHIDDLKLYWALKPGYGGTFSFRIDNIDRETCHNAINELQLFIKAVSLGGTESLIEHVASTTHNETLFDENKQTMRSNISEGLIRINIGLEPPQLLMKDLQKMFEYVRYHCKDIDNED